MYTWYFTYNYHGLILLFLKYLSINQDNALEFWNKRLNDMFQIPPTKNTYVFL